MATGLISVKDFGAVGDGTTADQAALIAAITAAKEANSDLYWPGGRYLSTATLPDVHSVAHIGSGIIVRKNSSGGDFEFCPGQWTDDRTNRIYVSSVGNNEYDGLTPTRPVKTLNQGFNAAFLRRSVLSCQWEFELAPGVYGQAVLPAEGKISAFPIRIVGKDKVENLEVPTTIIGDDTNKKAVGLISYHFDLYVENILFRKFNMSASSAGIVISRHRLSTNNVHFHDCFYGITASELAILNVKGGIFQGCGYLNGDTSPGNGKGHAIRTMFLTKWEVGDPTVDDLSKGPIIRQCAGAGKVQELCTGHFDNVTVENCGHGLILSENARLNINGSSFKNIAGNAIDCVDGSYVNRSNTTLFGKGAERNNTNYLIGINSSSTSGAFSDIAMNVSRARNLFGFRSGWNIEPISTVSSAFAVDTLSLAGGYFDDPKVGTVPPKKIALKVQGNTTGTTGRKWLALRLRDGSPIGKILSCEVPKNIVGDFSIDFSVLFVGRGSQIASYVRALAADGSTFPKQMAMDVDMSEDREIILNAWVDNSADTINILSYEWFGQGL
ncbi:glycosyl hydrolase family 28-related protein [Advenella incenata]